MRRIVNFAVPADHWLKIKEREKRDKYINFAREQRQLENMIMTVIPIVFDTPGTVP